MFYEVINYLWIGIQIIICYNLFVPIAFFLSSDFNASCLEKQTDTGKANSTKGAFYDVLNKSNHDENFESFLNLIPNPNKNISEAIGYGIF